MTNIENEQESTPNEVWYDDGIVISWEGARRQQFLNENQKIHFLFCPN